MAQRNCDPAVVEQQLERALETRIEDPAQARQASIKAVAAARALGDETLCIRALNMLAQIERDAGETARARAYYEEIAALCLDGERLRRRAHALRHVGDILSDEGRYEEAEHAYSEALELYRNHPRTQPLEMANALRGQALLKSRTGDVDAAKHLWSHARALYAESGVESGFSECEERLSGLVPDQPA